MGPRRAALRAGLEAAFLRWLPVAVGSDGEGLLDAAVMAEELMAVEPGVALTLGSAACEPTPVATLLRHVDIGTTDGVA